MISDKSADMNHQRIDAESNTHAGNDFETRAQTALEARLGCDLQMPLTLAIGFDGVRKNHRFDLGSHAEQIIVECKSHRWTRSGNMPSAKLTVWREALYYFYLSDNSYRKILLVLRDIRTTNNETLADYFVRLNLHVIPPGVEIWEFCLETDKIRIVHA